MELQNLEKQYIDLCKMADEKLMCYKELLDKADQIQSQIFKIKNGNTYESLKPGTKIEFKDIDGSVVVGRLLLNDNKYYDLLIEKGNEFYPSNSVLGYRCLYIDTLIDFLQSEQDLKIFKIK